MERKDIYYGLLSYSSINIGDEIQSIAASRFLPRIDKLVHRENICNYKSDKKTKLIMNAWWMWRPEKFPPSNESIDPLIISMHINKEVRKKFLTKKTKKYLIEKGPVGCRDKSTMDFLSSNNIPAYFSGCLTLTLEPNKNITRKDYIVTVDIPEHIVEKIKEKTNRPVYNIHRELIPNQITKRIDIAKSVLYLYHSAHLVISSRLHVCMPSLALGTPVLMLDTNDNHLRNDGRYEGLDELCNVIKEEDIDSIDLENPIPNPKKYLEIRKNLIKKCEEFTGFNSNKSCIEEKDVDFYLYKVISALYFGRNYKKYIQWFVKPKDLLFTFLANLFLRKTRHDLKVNSEKK